MSQVTELKKASDEDQINLAIKNTFQNCISKNKSEDETKMAMIQSGATFKNVTRWYNSLMVESGLAMAKDDKTKVIEQTVQTYGIQNKEQFEQAVANIISSVPNTTTRSASSMIRGYAKKKEIPYYAPEVTPVGEGAGFTKRYLEWIVSQVQENNKVPDVEVAKKFIQGTDGFRETSENTKRHESYFLKYINFAERLIAKA